MQYRRRLRSRIVLSFLVFGTLLSALFALSTLFLQNYLEDQLIGTTLKRELDDYVDQLRLDPSVVEPFYTRIQGYITRPGDPNKTVAAEVRDLPEGVHDVRMSNNVFKAAVRKESEPHHGSPAIAELLWSHTNKIPSKLFFIFRTFLWT